MKKVAKILDTVVCPVFLLGCFLHLKYFRLPQPICISISLNEIAIHLLTCII